MSDSLAADLGDSVSRLQARIRRRLGTQRLGLSAVRTLITLAREGPKRLTELAAIEQVTQPSMSVLVARLVGEGLVERSADATDGRIVIVSISEDGRGALQAILKRRDELLAAALDELTASERTSLREAVPAIVRLLEVLEERTPVGDRS